MSELRAHSAARSWLVFADDDLRAAQALRDAPDDTARHACFFAQQVAEKALKAVLAFEGAEVPRLHDLDALRTLLAEGWAVKTRYPDLAALTEYPVSYIWARA